MNSELEEPSADMRMLARTMRDMFAALVAGGFTEQQALTLIGQTIAASMNANRGKS